MAADFINVIQEIRGDGSVPTLDTDGTLLTNVDSIWGKVSSLEKKTELSAADGASSLEASIILQDDVTTKHDNVVAKSLNVDTKSSIVDTKYDIIAITPINGNADGMHGDIVTKHTEIADTVTNGNAGGMHGDIEAKFTDIAVTMTNGSVGKYGDMVTKYDDIAVTSANGNVGKYGDIVAKYGDIAVTTTNGNLNGMHGDIETKHAELAVTVTNGNNGGIHGDILVMYADMLTSDTSLAAHYTAIDTVADDLALGLTSKIAGVYDGIQYTSVVGSDLLSVNSKISEVYNELQTNQKISKVYNDLTDVTYSHIANAKVNGEIATTQAGIATTQADESEGSATQARLDMWTAEAIRRTADSYATQATDVIVKVWSSNGDGTFTQVDSNPAEYSAQHWKNKASAFSGDIETADMTFTNKVIDGISNNTDAQRTIVRVKAIGSTPLKGDLVKQVGWDSTSNVAEISVISSISDVVFGVCHMAILESAIGTITSLGIVPNVYTTGMVQGGPVYSDGSGGFTGAKPSGMYQNVGVFTNIDSAYGSIYINLDQPEVETYSKSEIDSQLLEPLQLDKVIGREDIVGMVYNGGTQNDKLSGIDYTNNYDEVLVYDVNDKLQFVDHQIGNINQAYSELVYTTGKLTSVTFTNSARV